MLIKNADLAHHWTTVAVCGTHCLGTVLRVKLFLDHFMLVTAGKGLDGRTLPKPIEQEKLLFSCSAVKSHEQEEAQPSHEHSNSDGGRGLDEITLTYQFVSQTTLSLK